MKMSGVVYRGLAYLKHRNFTNDSVINSLRTRTVRYFSVTHKNNMKLVQFTYNLPEGSGSGLRVGYIEGENVVDLNKADSSLPTTLLGVLSTGSLEKVKKLKSSNPKTVPLSSVTLAAPITGMDKVLCIGLNYKDHCEEQNLTPPPVPMIFSKFASCVIGPNDVLKLRTQVTKKVDWEVELAVVIGKKTSFVKAANAFDHVMGYTVAQDISARDWQKERNAGQFLLGKAMDTFCPIGPWIVTSDEIGDPQNLNIRSSINGEVKQKSKTDQLIHKIPDVIERLSSVMTLYPGDIILTGTPGGVGMYRNPSEYLKPGDVIESEIQNIGVLTTKVVDAK
ncbi:fumarylacetoacetate hydrolase domain-containing protein 2 [Amyelois transitella]|uniref:fumarylacetoacetate hydrolase domain-containing protein 2 n=1 Tax=Amyelois transitella TaxID=680683 RepID=UPI00067E03A6|nr:fumarylacetoacetate hydrolase domain-containing protein 2 [Amyelois transitella]